MTTCPICFDVNPIEVTGREDGLCPGCGKTNAERKAERQLRGIDEEGRLPEMKRRLRPLENDNPEEEECDE